MADYYNHIKGLLTGKLLDIPRERLDWTGVMEVRDLFNRTPVGERSQIIEAMQAIIDNEREDWGVVADTIYLTYLLRIEELKSAIKSFQQNGLPQAPPKWKEVVGRQVETYLQAGI